MKLDYSKTDLDPGWYWVSAGQIIDLSLESSDTWDIPRNFLRSVAQREIVELS
jgi:hypothetical protein